MILADIGKFVGAKVATAVIFLAVAGAGYWCYQNPESLKAGANVVKLTLVWIVATGALPWTSYLFMRPLLEAQGKMQSAQGAAAVGAAIVGVYCLIDVMLAFYLAGWSIQGSLTWIVVMLGFIAAGAYNFVICESLARQADA